MKGFILAASVFSAAVTANEVPLVPLDMACLPERELNLNLYEDHGEIAFVEGISKYKLSNVDDHHSAVTKLYLNPDKLTFTLVAVFGDMGCVLAGGEEFRSSEKVIPRKEVKM